MFAARQLGISAHDARVGTRFSAGAVGSLQATISIPRMTRRFSPVRLNLVGRTFAAVLLATLALQRDFVAALVLYAARWAADMLAIRGAITFRQLNTPDALQGRVNVLGRMLSISGTPVGAALGGALAQTLGVRTALLVAAAGSPSAPPTGGAARLRAHRSLAPQTP